MFEKLTADLTAARQALVEMGRAAFKPAILEFMAAHPEVEALRWKAGTPSFADGDPCLFTIDEPEVKFVKQAGASPTPVVEASDDDDDDDWDDDEDDDDFLDSWSFPEDLPGRDRLVADIQSLYAVLQSAEDAVLAMFGDGVEVTVGRDGVAEVDSYDCE